MKARMFAPLLALTAGMALSACDGARYSHVIPVSPTPAAPAAYRYVASLGGPLRMEVYAPPATVRGADLAAAFPSPPFYNTVRFTTVLPPDSRPELADYRVVLVFSAPVAFDGDDACALTVPPATTPARPPVPEGDDLMAAFCWKDQTLRQVRVSGSAPAFAGGVTSPAAQAVLSQVSGYLVPECKGGSGRSSFTPNC